jgi:DNA polymerase-3 subunit delta
MAKGKKAPANAGYDQLKADIRAGNFRKMYIFYGEERYLLENYRAQLRKKLVSGPAEDFNYHRFQEENWSMDDLSEAVEAIPMMSDRSLVEVVDVDPFARPESERQALTTLFSELPDYCTLIFIYDAVEWKPDKRMKKLWAALDAAALQVEFPKQPESQLIPWIRRHLATAQKTMSDDLCRYLLLQTGGSMTVLAAELQKLICYTDQPQITRKDIDDVVIPVMEAAIFDITKDIGRKNFDAALQKLRDLLRQDTEPISINAVIGRQLRQLYCAKVLSEHGKGPYDLTKLYGLWDSAAREIYNQARGFRKQMLRQALRISAQTDYALKSSGAEEEALLEMMVLKMAETCGGIR